MRPAKALRTLLRRRIRGHRGSTGPETAPTGPIHPKGWVASLRLARWTDRDSLLLHGWAFVRDDEFTAYPSDLRVYLQHLQTRETVEATVEQWITGEPNAVSANGEVDRSFTAFSARFDLSGATTAMSSGSWVARIAFDRAEKHHEGGFRRRYAGGSAGALRASVVHGHTLVSPRWDKAQGLVLDSTPVPAVVTSSMVERGRLTMLVECAAGFEPVASHLVDYADSVAIETTLAVDEQGVWRVALSPIEESLPEHSWRLHLTDGTGQSAPARWAPWRGPGTGPGGSTPAARRDDLARVVIDSVPPLISIEQVDVVGSAGTEPVLRLAGRQRPGQSGRLSLGLVGPRRSAWSPVVPDADDRFVVDVALTFPAPLHPYGRSSRRLTMPSADYDLVVRDEDRPDDDHVPTLDEAVRESLYRTVRGSLLNARLEQTGDAVLRAVVRPPRGEDEIGAFNTRRLNAEDREHPPPPADSAYFESFFGDHVACNPLALHDEYARRFPDHTRYWGIRDFSIAVPDGAIPVIIGTREWRQARSRSRLLVVNDWLRHFNKKPHQTVVQTWHGTPYKKLALDRPGRRDDEEFVASVARQVRHWDYVLSQNAFMTDALRSSYAPPSEVLEVGYPRNDVLRQRAPGDALADLRAELGVDPVKKVVLYAPTRRETDRTTVRLLDLEQLVGDLGDDYTVLVRGHMTALGVDDDLHVDGVVDVTSYPEVNDLFTLSDLMITDYSSVMFDYANTAKPMLFYVPDMESYVNEQRGVYFDLPATAPGPLLRTTDEIVSALRDLDGVQERYRDAYQAWVERFVPHDDGKVAQRALDIVLGTGSGAGP